MKDWPSYRSWNCHLHCITRVATPKVQLCLQLQKEIHQFLIELQLPEVGFEPGTSGVTVWHATNWAMVTWLDTQLFYDNIAQLLGIAWELWIFCDLASTASKMASTYTKSLSSSPKRAGLQFLPLFGGFSYFSLFLEHFRHSNELWGQSKATNSRAINRASPLKAP